MMSPVYVVSWHKSDETDGTVGVSQLETAKSSVVDLLRSCKSITVGAGDNSAIDTLSYLVWTPCSRPYDSLTVALHPHNSTYTSGSGRQVVVSMTLISR